MPIATKSSKFDISKESDTAKIARKFSKRIKKGDTLLFFGEIGVGKTTFIRYFINNFQKTKRAKQTEVTSPTFTLLNEYEIKDLIIQHYDLYRLKNKKELKNIGFLDNFENEITLVEWAEKIAKKPKNRIELHFEYKAKLDKRILKIYDFR
tara:strand:+ start:404 stop:856 length:453 start_codon:yes stop_codon:yes gene_type:complete